MCPAWVRSLVCVPPESQGKHDGTDERGSGYCVPHGTPVHGKFSEAAQATGPEVRVSVGGENEQTLGEQRLHLLAGFTSTSDCLPLHHAGSCAVDQMLSLSSCQEFIGTYGTQRLTTTSAVELKTPPQLNVLRAQMSWELSAPNLLAQADHKHFQLRRTILSTFRQTRAM